jgi:TRAP-type C4-dicarboxylate transport system substrate-binding protein
MSEQRLIRARASAAAAAGALLLVVACSADDQASSGGDDKAGGSPDPVVLTMAETYSGLKYEPAVQYFVDQVEDLSGGALRIEARDEVGDFAADAEQQVVQAVAAGDIDIAWVGTRVFDTLGVTSFQALTAPMLIDSYPLQQAVIESDIPAEMLAGLDDIGVTGIAVLADGLRKPIAVEQPLVSPADFDGITFQAFRSKTHADAVRALGANLTEAFGPNLDTGLIEGDVQGFEKNLHIYDVNGTSSLAPYVTANVNLWPQTVALIANPDVVDDLTDEQRQWLMQAGADAAEHSTDLVDGDGELVARLCEVGARFAIASDADLDAFAEAFAPVYTTLEADAQTKRFIEQIRQLKVSTDPGPALEVPSECTGPAPVGLPDDDAASIDGDGDATVASISGTYRWTVTEADARANGDARLVTPELLPWYPMIGTMTLDDGRWELLWRGPDGATATDGPGTYTIDGDRLELELPGDPSSPLTFTFTIDNEGHIDIEPILPMEEEAQFVYAHYRWERIDGGRSAGDGSAADDDQSTLNGVYRWTLTEDDALAHGNPSDKTPESLATYPWIFTMTMTDGAWELRHRDGEGDWDDGSGPYTVDTDRVVFDWNGSLLEFTFTHDDDGTLHLEPAAPMNSGDMYVWSTKPWVRIDGGELNQPSEAAVVNGTYRREVTEAEFLAAGVDSDNAHREAGIYTLTLADGHFLWTTRNDFNLPDCEGTFSVAGQEITLVNTSCGVGEFFRAEWTFENGELHFENVQAPVVIEVPVGGGAWTKIR